MTDQRPNIFPIVHYNDEAAAITWLCDVLGFEACSLFATTTARSCTLN